jgi:hypothetical protein
MARHSKQISPTFKSRFTRYSWPEGEQQNTTKTNELVELIRCPIVLWRNGQLDPNVFGFLPDSFLTRLRLWITNARSISLSFLGWFHGYSAGCWRVTVQRPGCSTHGLLHWSDYFFFLSCKYLFSQPGPTRCMNRKPRRFSARFGDSWKTPECRLISRWRSTGSKILRRGGSANAFKYQRFACTYTRLRAID